MASIIFLLVSLVSLGTLRILLSAKPVRRRSRINSLICISRSRMEIGRGCFGRRSARLLIRGGESFTSKNTHSLSCRKGACAASAITFRVQPFGAGHRRREFGLQTLLSLFQRIERWLSIKLRGIRLWRCQSSAWISLGLAYFCFEFSNVLPHGPAWAMGD